MLKAAHQRAANARSAGPRSGVAPAAPTRSAKGLTTSQVSALWLQYGRTGDRRLRDRLVMHYAPLVRDIARRNASHFPATCDLEDVISCGLIELIRAIDRYDPVMGAAPTSFLWTRIQGAIRDHRRALDWLPRAVRRTEGQMQAARLDFAALHGRVPSSAELAETVGGTPALVHRHEHRMARADIASLNEIVVEEHVEDPYDPHEPVERIDMVHSVDASGDPWRAAAVTEAKVRFRAAFSALTERQRQIAAMLYADELTLQKVALVVGVSEARVSQIHKEIRESLRHVLLADASLLREVG
jgi:RNA polymerase sigma factor for flagellar operon FliA